MSDATARREAVEPQRSVIVQAPAGSGKTTLLVERYLGLLAVVEAPEEILAITFTRKAAAEMRLRVLHYLDPNYDSNKPHEQAALAKAKAVRAKVAQWQLLENPQRLLIRTIDSFNHFLARSMPIASQLGPVPSPADNTNALYRQAARRLLLKVDDGDAIADHIQNLLVWRDHRSQDIENLIAEMLGKRDQWLRALQVTGLPQRQKFEAVFQALAADKLSRLNEALDRALRGSGTSPEGLASLLQFSATTLIANKKASPITVYASAADLPNEDPETLPLWRGLAEALLTKDGPFRATKGINKSLGFPSGKPEREHFQQLLEALYDFSFLPAQLHEVRRLPDAHYSDEEWQVLDSLVEVLLRATSELNLIFLQQNQSDYSGLAAAALRGLGDEEQGITDLGLYLDRRIQHILVDEFQDTNSAQMQLIEKLTSGWEPDDGRSLFVVGDPMQSIYRFREAEVGLFIQARKHGIGNLMLEPKQLTRNFRSNAEVVHWINDNLEPIFPAAEDVAAGAVAYARSEPGLADGGRVELCAYPNPEQEAAAIVERVQAELEANKANPSYKAAIIVRARSHLAEIIPMLNTQGIAFRALKLDSLLSQPVAQDLFALTRAIVQPADISALLAVLRSPICGLNLEELTQLAGDGASPFDPNALKRLPPAAQQRAKRVFDALADTQDQWQQRNLRDLVEGLWERFGGPACYASPIRDRQNAIAYLDALTQAEADGLLADWNDFIERLEDIQTEGDPASDDVKLEVLTVHGAKGLEWDLVILPQLHKGSRVANTQLLYWLPFVNDGGAEDILLAPLKSSEEEKNPPLVQLINDEQKKRATYENQRLLYVATTRAKHQLVLTACIDPDAENFKPKSDSLLADLWPTCESDFLASTTKSSESRDIATEPVEPGQPHLSQSLRRIEAGWEPALGERLEWQAALPSKEPDFDVEYNWAGLDARRNGTVLHRLLERVGNLGIENLDIQGRELLMRKIPLLLRAMGVAEAELDKPKQVIQQALEATLDSTEGQRILSNEHPEAACELAISGFVDGELVNAIVDRTFVDDNGVRWIIDYKSGYHDGGDLQGFFREERKRYTEQLNRYRQLFQQLEDRKVITALYLPRHDHLEIVE